MPNNVDIDLELVARLRVAVARLSRQLRQQSGTGLPLSRQSALVSIEQRGPLTLGELAAIEQIAPATVTKIVTKLVHDGLVTRTTDPEDRRVSRVELTAAGADQLAESRSRRNAWLATRVRAADAPTPEHLRIAADVLEALARAPGPDEEART
jgi:DNA-binding MarR family transcriptional regulator